MFLQVTAVVLKTAAATTAVAAAAVAEVVVRTERRPTEPAARQGQVEVEPKATKMPKIATMIAKKKWRYVFCLALLTS